LKFHKTPHIRHYAGFKTCPYSAKGNGEFSKGYFYWEFDAKPSYFSKIYRVLLIWDFKYLAPKIFILDNELHNIGQSRKIPHLYDREKIQLCLYYPQYSEFNEMMPLCDTIIPWTYLWLQYYEEWVYSDDWKGGDAPHAEISSAEENFDSTQESNKVKKVKKAVTDIIYARRKKAFDIETYGKDREIYLE